MKNKPRIFSNTLKINDNISSLVKVYLPFVTIEKNR